MKKLTLFNIELKCDINQYNGHVAAENASEAEEMAREMVLADHLVWWAQEEKSIRASRMIDEGGEMASEEHLDEILQKQMEELENMRLTTLIEVGEVIV